MKSLRYFLIILFENLFKPRQRRLAVRMVTDFVSSIHNLKTVFWADFVSSIHNLKNMFWADFVSLIYNLKTVFWADFVSLIYNLKAVLWATWGSLPSLFFDFHWV